LKEVEAFRAACAAARIPDIRANRSLRSILEWTLAVLTNWKPKLTYRLPESQGEFELDLGKRGTSSTAAPDAAPNVDELPQYVSDIRHALAGC
jgi:predicted ATPase